MSVFSPRGQVNFLLVQTDELTFPAATLLQRPTCESSGSVRLGAGMAAAVHQCGGTVSNVPVTGQGRAESFAFSPSSSWELGKLLLLIGKSQEIILPWKVGC